MNMKKVSKWLFQDNTGKYVIAQPPNVLIYIMLVSFIAKILTRGTWASFFDLLFFGAAFAWSYLEIRFGESGIRRIAGVVVLVVIITSRLVK